MDGTGEDELAGELFDLTRQLRGQLLRHASLGAWAAPGTASTRDLPATDESTHEPDLSSASPASASSVTAPAAPTAATAPAPTATAATPMIAPAAFAASTPIPTITHAAPAASSAPAAIAPAAPAFTLTSPTVERAAKPAAISRTSEPVEPVAAQPRRTLPQIREDLGDCTRCKLHSTRRSIVFGVGSPDTPLMFVGEAPGEQEDKRGEPFVGPAGELLDKMIEAMGWTRKAVYIANTTKCRPPGNRNPQPDELSQCMPFLHAQITSIAPRIIVALGRPASNQLLEVDAPISSLRGKFHDYPRLGRGSLKVMPTFHPAYLLRDPSKKRLAWDDLKLVMAELARLGIASPNAVSPAG